MISEQEFHHLYSRTIWQMRSAFGDFAADHRDPILLSAIGANQSVKLKTRYGKTDRVPTSVDHDTANRKRTTF